MLCTTLIFKFKFSTHIVGVVAVAVAIVATLEEQERVLMKHEDVRIEEHFSCVHRGSIQ